MPSASSPASALSPAAGPRIRWVDGARGIGILWIAFFHTFIAYGYGHYPWPLGFSNFPSFIQECTAATAFPICGLEGLIVALQQRGAQTVGVLLVLSGFGLTCALAKSEAPQDGWRSWYSRRLVRLFPLYWAAHLVYLLSPIAYEQDPIDIRFLLSFFGNRILPVETMFFYLTPAWWYFGLLLELYLVFPFLFILLRRIGPAAFFGACALFTIASRYVLQSLLEAHGYWSMGAFFGARLWEFAAGMSLAAFYQRNERQTERVLFSPLGFGVGVLLYLGGVYSYEPHFFYTVSDGLTGTGLFVIIAHGAIWVKRMPLLRTWIPRVGAYSYGIFLLHQPYVMFCGRLFREHDVGFGLYMVAASAVVGAICLLCIPLEKGVERLVGRFWNRGASPAPRPPAS